MHGVVNIYFIFVGEAQLSIEIKFSHRQISMKVLKNIESHGKDNTLACALFDLLLIRNTLLRFKERFSTQKKFIMQLDDVKCSGKIVDNVFFKKAANLIYEWQEGNEKFFIDEFDKYFSLIK